MTTALFVGRFQPFHLGHLKAVRKILQENDSLVIAIGSCQASRTAEDPFSFEERRDMITAALRKDGVTRFRIIGVPDCMNDHKWVCSIQEQASFDRVYTTNPWTIRCFQKKHIPVIEHEMYDRERYNATGIRRRMASGEEWESLVPAKIAEFIKQRAVCTGI